MLIKWLVLMIIFFLLLVMCFYLFQSKNNDFEEAELTFLKNNKTITIEIADDPKERARGLMYRKYLSDDKGMLFIFPEERILSFWMENTKIPLEIYFIDEDFNIIDIQHMLPCEKEPCKKYVSKYPAKYALEINQGFSKNNNVSLDDKVYFSSFVNVS